MKTKNGIAADANVASKGGRNLLTSVWVCVLVLSLLVVVSVSSVGAYASTYASRDPEVLFLDTANGNELSGTMDLFSNAYVDASGQAVVASSDGEKIIAPGTSGSYSFSVRNSGGQPATYSVWAETSQSGSDQTIPVSVSLESGMRTCDNLSDAGQLAPGSCAVYRIAWEWPFEQASAGETALKADGLHPASVDSSDTALGQQATVQPVSYTVKIHMKAEADEAAVASANMAKTSDGMRPIALAALAAAFVACIALAFARRKRAGVPVCDSENTAA